MTGSLLVSVDIDGEPVEVGSAYFSRRRGTSSASFQYAPSYLADRRAYAIDPVLGLFAGPQQTDGLPGAFADCSPDRWGRGLITKRLQALALREVRTAPSLGDADFLVGVSDLSRQGALRFRAIADGPFLDPDLNVPKLVELPRLLQAVDQVAGDGDDLAAVKALLDAGSGSLGGARPKASVRDGDRLLIAKFPHRGDDWDVMAWEKTALDLAERAGIEVPGSELLEIDGRHVLVLDRFDRDGVRRRGYISAMTLIEARDGDVHDYVEVAETLTEHGARVKTDLHELWRRIAFSVAIHNTDDHLRNHGFLREAGGWGLSPVFDINPNPIVSEARVTGIGGARSRADELTGLMTYAETFDLSARDAQRILREVGDATGDWRRVAAAHGIGEAERHRFEPAFDGLREELATVANGAASADGARPRASGQPRVQKGSRRGGQFAARPERERPSS
ncbi:type II toxin-antitoxin system HipA family toxin [Kribbella sp. CA-245084]|uniref:type II toxin-antitoxin system HipA family toxin n=1 Tax=Kribbella sp. CA-245084 TaxID=3239940 RepID=UPI003D8C81EB